MEKTKKEWNIIYKEKHGEDIGWGETHTLETKKGIMYITIAKHSEEFKKRETKDEPDKENMIMLKKYDFVLAFWCNNAITGSELINKIQQELLVFFGYMIPTITHTENILIPLNSIDQAFELTDKIKELVDELIEKEA